MLKKKKKLEKGMKIKCKRGKKKISDCILPRLFINTIIQIIRTVGTFSYDVYVAAITCSQPMPSITGSRI